MPVNRQQNGSGYFGDGDDLTGLIEGSGVGPAADVFIFEASPSSFDAPNGVSNFFGNGVFGDLAGEGLPPGIDTLLLKTTGAGSETRDAAETFGSGSGDTSPGGTGPTDGTGPIDDDGSDVTPPFGDGTGPGSPGLQTAANQSDDDRAAAQRAGGNIAFPMFESAPPPALNSFVSGQLFAPSGDVFGFS